MVTQSGSLNLARRSSGIVLVALVFLFPLTSASASRGPDEVPLDASALLQMEQRADAAQPRDQCYMFAEVLHGLTELAGREIAAGDDQDASTTLTHIDSVAAKMQKASAANAKRLKNAEMLLEHITRRLERHGACRVLAAAQRNTGSLGACESTAHSGAGGDLLQMTLRFRVRQLAIAVCALLLVAPGVRAYAQDDDSSMSQKEIEGLRDAAYIPNDRVLAFIKILNTRDDEIEDLLRKPRHAGFNQDMHDLLDQFATIADEFNDNLDEYSSKHRDIRKSLPKLVNAIERWQTTLRAAGEDEAYNVVRKMALDSLKDMRDTADTAQTEQAAYFKAHPDAAKLEKERADPEHSPVPQ